MKGRVLRIASLDLALMLRRSELVSENRRLRERIAEAEDRIRFLEELLGMKPGEEIAPLRKPLGWFGRTRTVA